MKEDRAKSGAVAKVMTLENAEQIPQIKRTITWSKDKTIFCSLGMYSGSIQLGEE